MKNLKGSQPQRWIESSLGMLKNSHLFWPELSSLLIISYSWGFLRLKIMENSNHFVPREKLFIFEIASLTRWSPHLARAACEAVQVAWKHTEKKVEPLVPWPLFKSIKSCWTNKSYWTNKFCRAKHDDLPIRNPFLHWNPISPGWFAARFKTQSRSSCCHCLCTITGTQRKEKHALREHGEFLSLGKAILLAYVGDLVLLLFED